MTTITRIDNTSVKVQDGGVISTVKDGRGISDTTIAKMLRFYKNKSKAISSVHKAAASVGDGYLHAYIWITIPHYKKGRVTQVVTGVRTKDINKVMEKVNKISGIKRAHYNLD